MNAKIMASECNATHFINYDQEPTDKGEQLLISDLPLSWSSVGKHNNLPFDTSFLYISI